MSTICFSVPSTGDVAMIRHHTHRYWLLHRSEGLNIGQDWIRWTEAKARSKNAIDMTDRNTKYILDIIDNKVIKCTMTFRELHMMNARRWPLREKMLEAMEERNRGKSVRKKAKILAS